MLNKRKLTIGVVVLSFALLLFGATSLCQESQKGGTLELTASSSAEDLDPVTYESIASIRRMDLIYDSLLYRDPQGNPIPLLAKELPERPDDKTIVFHLHEGVKFHDGSELTAEDVKYTFESIADPEEESPHRSQIADTVDSIETPDKYTVKLNMKNPTPLNIVTPFFRGIVSKENREEMGSEEYSRNPVGSGPFKMVEWKKDDYMLLERFDEYWMKKPNLEKVRFNIVPEESTQIIRLIKGELDIAGVPKDLLTKVEKENDVEVIKTAQYHYAAMVFNMKKPPLDKKKVRRAIHYLVDREVIMEAAQGELGRLNWSITPPVVNKAWDFPQEEWKQYLPEQNVEKAKELLDEAGLTGNPRFEITLTGLNLAYYPPITTIMQNQLAQANIKAEVRNLDLGTWLDELDIGTVGDTDPLKDQYDMIIYGWGAGPDPDGWLYYQFISERGEGTPNTAQFSNPEVDELLKEARNSINREKRRELYIEAQTKILEAYPHIPMFNNLGATGVRKRVQDYQPVPGYGEFTPLVTPFSNVWVEQ